MKEFFAVIIPVYNRAFELERAINSVLAQTFQNFHLYIVDDGSTDATINYLSAIDDHRISMITQKNRGVSAARNRAIVASDQPYIALLDSDDQWLADKLEQDYTFIQAHPEISIFQSNEIWVRNGRRVNAKAHHKKKSGYIFLESLELCMISPSSVILKRDLLTKYGSFDEKMRVCEDYDLWLRITAFEQVGLITKETMIKYGGAADQLSNSVVAIDRFRIYALYKLLIDQQYEVFHAQILSNLKIRISRVLQGAKKRNNTLLIKQLGQVNDYLEKESTQIDTSFLLQV